MPKILGIDEAGRGCVLGSLYVCGCCYETDSDDSLLKKLGATDSKKLSAKKRTLVLDLLKEHVHVHTVEITAQQIDAGNINSLEEEAFVEIIKKYAPDIVYIDAPTHPRGILAVQRRLEQQLAPHIALPTFIIEPKADFRYPIVGAASIFAKVQRDKALETMGPVGSGYPSDPVTKQWLEQLLRNNVALPDFVRTRWGTIENIQQSISAPVQQKLL